MSNSNQLADSAVSANPVKVGWVLRDMMQSTGVWTFDPDKLAQLVRHAVAVGFNSLEIGGGQSYQIALENGRNPYQIIRNAKTVIDDIGGNLPLQVLLRGANQLGFQHYDPEVQRRNIDLLIDAGGDVDKNKTLIIRNFDALNDAENLRVSLEYMVSRDRDAVQQNEAANKSGKTATAKRVHVQAALSYVRPANNEPNACYGVKYYVNYAKKLMAIADDVGGALDSFCIKDMSGQLTPAIARELIPALKQLQLPVFLHCHSTDEAQAMSVQAVAIQQGISGIEVAVEPLAGGASHNDVEHVVYLQHVSELNLDAIAALKQTLNELFQEQATTRKDGEIPLASLKALVRLGIPGGAIPFIVKDLQANVAAMLGLSLDEALVLFREELLKFQRQLGVMPLVTPTADIVAKQVIKTLGNSKRSAAYKLVDPRFCRLVLGHYGQLVNYATDEIISVDKELLDEVKEYCASIPPDDNGLRRKSERVYPEPDVLTTHPAKLPVDHHLASVEEYVDDLFSRYPQSCLNFGSKEECMMMHIMRPAGVTDRLLTQNILRPTEQRLRVILDGALRLLPGKDIPESRESEADETVDNLLLTELGDYDGIVSTIKNFVLKGDRDSIKKRVDQKMRDVIDPICANNPDAAKNRYYFERRFVALFAAAVFWDLQRVCRRTGSDSRANTDEMTARKLDKIISSTLRRRQQAGRGPASEHLS